MLPNFAYIRPTSLEGAIEQLASEDARLHAGGTDLLGCLREHIFDVKKVVSISRIKELRGIRKTRDGGLRIGALTSITEVAGHPTVKAHYPALAQAAAEVASPQLRNQGTLGGNICQKPRCWYYRGEFHCLRKGGDVCYALNGENHFHCILGGDMCYIVHPSDTATALVAFKARVRIAGPRGNRIVPMENFHVAPSEDIEKETILAADEIVTDIRLPPALPGTRSRYRKVRARRSWDFALAGVALAMQFDDDQVTGARVVFSGAAPIPWRSQAVENMTRGTALDPETVAQAAAAAMADAQPLGKNQYKIPLFRGMLEEELSAIGKGG